MRGRMWALNTDRFAVDAKLRLRACARKEAANLRLSVGAHVWPDYGRPKLIRLGHHCIVRHDDPFAVEPHAIVAVLRVPIDVVDPEAVGEGAAESVAAREPVEPGFQRRIGIPAIVTRERDDPPTADGWGKTLGSRARRPMPTTQQAVSL
jgi:hypothetical protein